MNYILYGEETYLLKEALTKIQEEYGLVDDEMNVIHYHAKQDKLRTVLDDAMTVPFFASHKLIIVDHCDFLSAKGSADWNLEELLAYCKKPVESSILVLIMHHDKLDGRKKAIKELQKVCRCLSFAKLDEQRKNVVVRELVKQYQLELTPKALDLLSLRLPTDMETIHKEMRILSLYGEKIDEETLSLFVSKPLEEDVFAMVNAIVKHQVKETFAIYRDLDALHHDPIYLLAVLAGQIRFLYQVSVLMNKGYGQKDIADTLHAHPYRVKLSMNTARTLNRHQLLSMLSRCAKLDQDMKAGKIDKKRGFELFLLQLY